MVGRLRRFRREAGSSSANDGCYKRGPPAKPSSQPSRRQAAIWFARLFAHRHRHLDSARSAGVGTWHRIVEEHHDPVARELVERSLELGDERPQHAMVFAQEIEDFELPRPGLVGRDYLAVDYRLVDIEQPANLVGEHAETTKHVPVARNDTTAALLDI